MATSINPLRARLALMLVTAVAVACEGPRSAAPPALAVQTAPLGVSGGNTPVPVFPCPEDRSPAVMGSRPCDPTQRAASWDGTYAQLLAADALAECRLQQVVYHTNYNDVIALPGLNELSQIMDRTSCPVATPAPLGTHNPTEQAMQAWLHHRTNPLCNAHPVTGQPAALAPRDTSGQQIADKAAYYIPEAVLPLTPVANLNIRAPLQTELAYAFVNMCMARKLASHIDSEQAVFASDADVIQLHQMARDRAAAAVHHYSLITKGFSLPYDVAMTPTYANYLPVLAQWRNWVRQQPAESTAREHFKRIGEDFALAIRLLVDTTERETELVLRNPEAQKGFGDYEAGASDPRAPSDTTVELRGARTRVLARTYGAVTDDFDPARTQQPARFAEVFGGLTTPPSVVPGFAMSGDVYAVANTVDMSAPEVGALIGLVRKADAFVISAFSHRIDIAANARALLLAAETVYRRDECAAKSLTDVTCSRVASSEDPAKYRVAQVLGVKIEHARTLVRALVEQIFGVPRKGDPRALVLDYSPAASGFSRGLQLPVDFPLRVRGTHTLTGAFSATSGGRLKLDPRFTFDNPALASQMRSWSYLPPAAFQQNQAAAEQGFGFALANIGGNDALLGTVPTLVLARHVLARANSGSTPVFSGLVPALDLLDAALGPRSVLVQPAVEWKSAAIETTTAVRGVPYRPDGLGGLRYSATNCMALGCNVVWRGARRYDIEVYRKDGDAFTINSVAAIPAAASASAALTDLSTVTTACTSGSTAACVLTPAVPTTTESGTRELLTTRIDLLADAPVLDLGFKSTATNRETVVRSTLDVGVPRFVNLQTEQATYGRAVAFGGSLTEAAQRAWEMQTSDWSKPRYDAFGITRVWNPGADASLHGGGENEEAYQYFLRVAGDAAGEATRALQTAYDGLKQQAGDDLALQQSEERGKTLDELELRDLCGESTSCDPYRCTNAAGAGVACPLLSLDVPECDSNLAAQELPKCASFREMVHGVIGKSYGANKTLADVRLAGPVLQQLGAQTPTFEGYEGGRLDKLLLAQWSAWKELDAAVGAAMSSGRSALDGVRAARGELEASIAESTETFWAIVAGYAELRSRGIDLTAQRDAFIDENVGLQEEIKFAGLASAACLDGEDQAMRSTVTYSSDSEAIRLPIDTTGCTTFVDRYKITPDYFPCGEQPVNNCKDQAGATCDPNTAICNCAAHVCWDEPPSRIELPRGSSPPPAVTYYGFHYTYVLETTAANSCGSKSFSVNPASFYAWQDRCAALQNQAEATGFANAARTLANEDRIAGLDAQLKLLPKQKPVLAARYVTAISRQIAAHKGLLAAESEASAAFMTQLLALQTVYDRLLLAGADIDRAVQETKLAQARIGLDASQNVTTVKSRLALSRSYRSYDLWRARALSESARRLAVAARRAIESRFVVDLSQLDSAETFVEAPSIWADEVYGSDLKPPAALGTTSGPEGGSGIYVNKLEDYVANLQLFVNGYAITRPTAVAHSDVEAVQLPGPAASQQTVADEGLTFSSLDPKSSGWSFYCDAIDNWFPHPNASDFNPQSFDLATACFGSPPSRARLGFWLDPWGRLHGHHMNAPFSARHNARWRRLATNLVGAGVRDCSAAADKQTCYAEPFIRYHLRHVGPALVTNYEEQWRSLDLPVAQIEAGKALSTEEWLDPVVNSFNEPTVANVARHEFAGRPVGGAYELILELTPDVRVERIERIQLLAETDYWVRQEGDGEPERDPGLPTCGNGRIEPPELCDGNCPGFCPSDGNVCTTEKLEGASTLCSLRCVTTAITSCTGGDGCCAPGCTAANDDDCAATGCHNGVVETASEQCDPGVPVQSATCDSNCTLAICGDDTLNTAAGETCDGTCPATCDDGNACTRDSRTGDTTRCNVACTNTWISTCSMVADGCCPAGSCNGSNDADCSPLCGNNVVDPGETCDGSSSCYCQDYNDCTIDTQFAGSWLTCDTQCKFTPKTQCSHSDLCCPPGCTAANDSDCTCGNGVVNLGENCDGNCPTSCTDTDGDACTGAVLTGSPLSCNVRCAPQSACLHGDGCCPRDCTGLNDNDCDPACTDVTDTVANHEAAGRATKLCTLWTTGMEGSTTVTTHFTGTTGIAQVTQYCVGTAGTLCQRSGSAALRMFGGGLGGSGTPGSSANVWKDLDTSGMTNVTLEYYRRAYAVESTDPPLWVVDFSTDGGMNWSIVDAPPTLPTGSPAAYEQRVVANLPSSPTLRIRFGMRGNDTTDMMILDDLTVSGNGGAATSSCRWYAAGTGRDLGTNSTARVTLPDPALVAAGAVWADGACTQVNTGSAHTVAIHRGQLWAWGRNADGQLGLGTTAQANVPTRVGTATDWIRASAGGFHTCGIRSGGVLYCWGDNGVGQLGNGSTGGVDVLAPGTSLAFTDWTAVSAGHGSSTQSTTCAIRSGMLYCWGFNGWGAVGDGSGLNRAAPVQVGTDNTWTSVDVGNYHACGIRAGGLYCWGNNGNGQLGDGSTSLRYAPVQVGTSADWTQVGVGQYHTCGTRGGSLYCWGYNVSGRLGIGTTVQQTAPALVTGSSWSEAAGGDTYSCARAAGSLSCWGSGISGATGFNDQLDRGGPSPVDIYGDWSAITAGGAHSCGIRDNARVYCWGLNSTGQVGNNSTANRFTPINVTPVW